MYFNKTKNLYSTGVQYDVDSSNVKFCSATGEQAKISKHKEQRKQTLKK